MAWLPLCPTQQNSLLTSSQNLTKSKNQNALFPPTLPCHRENGLQEYYPRFMAQGLDEVEEVRKERRLDHLLDSVGMTANPG